jgi:sulfur-carrier protein adenylyltransferase/sulfurtransferase
MAAENSITSKILTPPELRRFQHQIKLKHIGISGQEKLKVAKAIVIGAGGIGAQALQFLAASGVGHMTIVDDALVSEQAIHLQTLYGGNDLGKLKTIISRQQLQDLYPLSTFEILNLRINSENAVKFLTGCDIIIDATNNPQSSYIINDTCLKLKRSWVYGHTSGFTGEVTVFNHKHGPSYRCLYPEGFEPDDYDDSLALVFGAVGCMVATESIKLILNSPEVLSSKVLNFDLYSNIFVQQPLARVDKNFGL